jgi:hypothetical protein
MEEENLCVKSHAEAAQLRGGGSSGTATSL